jgi:hypothetical protein
MSNPTADDVLAAHSDTVSLHDCDDGENVVKIDCSMMLVLVRCWW